MSWKMHGSIQPLKWSIIGPSVVLKYAHAPAAMPYQCLVPKAAAKAMPLSMLAPLAVDSLLAGLMNPKFGH